MRTSQLLTPTLEERCYGSSFDPLLCGVAQGLERLFPPVAGTRPAQRPERMRPNPAFSGGGPRPE